VHPWVPSPEYLYAALYARRTRKSVNTSPVRVPESVDELQATLRKELYVADRGLAMSVYLALRLNRPLFLEGEAGVGKTEVAKALATAFGARLIRLQCYEGLDVSQAVYEWNYSRQLLHIRLMEASGNIDKKEAEKELFSEEFLIKRPLLQALEGTGPTVLLIDELDRADEEFEGYLLELLSDFQITIPEIGTYKTDVPPIVVITSNRTREIHDALKRRCLYHWIDYPDLAKETQIVRSKMPEASQKLASQVTAFVQELRTTELYKVPGVAETLDWTAALVSLNENELTPSVIDDTLGVMLKYREDLEATRGEQTRALVNRALNPGTRRGRRRG
jgi:MoxR-like ATPase